MNVTRFEDWNLEADPVRSRLRAAVRAQEAPLYLEIRVRAQLRAAESRGVSYWRAAPVAAMLCVAALMGWQVASLRRTVAAQDAYLRTVTTQVGGLLKVGLSDHLHCAVMRGYPASAPPEQDLLKDARVSALVRAVKPHVPAGFTLWVAHRCRDGKRRFVHLVYRHGAEMLSLAVLRREDGESLGGVQRAAVQRYQVAAFEAGEFVVFAISDLPGEENARVLMAMAGAVRGSGVWR